MTTRIIAAQWSPCPAGTLRTIGYRATRQTNVGSRRSFLAGAAAGVLIGGLGLGAAALRQKQGPPGNLTCAQCIEFFPAFSRAELEKTISHRVEVHLAKCPHCRDQFEQQYA